MKSANDALLWPRHMLIENNDNTEVTPLHKTYSKDNSLKHVCEYQKALQEALEILKTP